MNMQQEIIQRLQFLDPVILNLTDESAQHAGHKGNGGGSHFKLKIVSSHFSGKSQIMRHRLIYQSLSDLMPHKIHALSIEAIAQDELR
ncbi:MAG: BolA family transcriptional regulator [Methylotenera sp.]|nr:BolA family transcriptional regulator [Methylotenera sp.]